MKLVKPSVEILNPFSETEPLNGELVLKHLERVGRVCYKSEDYITDDSDKKFLEMIIKRGHESVVEHFSISVKFTCDRAMSHQIVRHRLSSFAQESQRYCNYIKEKFGSEITFIENEEIIKNEKALGVWLEFLKFSEETYFKLIEFGVKPEDARSVLANATKTEIVMTANIREWRHFIKMRIAKSAQHDIRGLAIQLLNQFKKEIPIVFDDIAI